MVNYANLSKGVKRIVVENEDGEIVAETKNALCLGHEVGELPRVTSKELVTAAIE